MKDRNIILLITVYVPFSISVFINNIDTITYYKLQQAAQTARIKTNNQLNIKAMENKKRYSFMPFPENYTIGEIEVSVELTNEEYEKCKTMPHSQFEDFIKARATVKITDFSVDFEVPTIDEFDIE